MPSSPPAHTPASAKPLGSVAITHGIRVAVSPSFLPDHSDTMSPNPATRRFVFSYRIRITNESAQTCRLMSRHWVIVDAHGKREEVRGPGVVGQTPRLQPGQSFEYSSYCPLTTPWGTMEGSFQFRVEPDAPRPTQTESDTDQVDAIQAPAAAPIATLSQPAGDLASPASPAKNAAGLIEVTVARFYLAATANAVAEDQASLNTPRTSGPRG